MKKASEETGETVSLAIPFGDLAMVVWVEEGSAMLRTANKEGRVLPPTGSSLAKILAAARDRQGRTAMLNAYGFIQFDPDEPESRTIPEILEDFDQIARQGWAHDDQETIKGVCCFGAPVKVADRDSGQRVVASVSISMPCSRASDRTGLADQVVALGCSIGGKLSSVQSGRG
jgi:DNA-binding IclR family transcriptional regulator